MESPTFGSASMWEARVTFMELSRPLVSRIKSVSSILSISPVMFWQGDRSVQAAVVANLVPEAGFDLRVSS